MMRADCMDFPLGTTVGGCGYRLSLRLRADRVLAGRFSSGRTSLIMPGALLSDETPVCPIFVRDAVRVSLSSSSFNFAGVVSDFSGGSVRGSSSRRNSSNIFSRSSCASIFFGFSVDTRSLFSDLLPPVLADKKAPYNLEPYQPTLYKSTLLPVHVLSGVRLSKASTSSDRARCFCSLYDDRGSQTPTYRSVHGGIDLTSKTSANCLRSCRDGGVISLSRSALRCIVEGFPTKAQKPSARIPFSIISLLVQIFTQGFRFQE